MNGVKGDMPVEALLRKFKKVCERANVLNEVKNRRQFEKPSEEKRRKSKDAARRMRKERMEELSGSKRRK